MAYHPKEVKDQSYCSSQGVCSICERMTMKMEEMKMRKKRRMEMLITQEMKRP
jgi:hypothetical protein